MLKYIKQFANHTAYQSAESNLDKPNVSLCVQEDEIHYNPIVPPTITIWANEACTIKPSGNLETVYARIDGEITYPFIDEIRQDYNAIKVIYDNVDDIYVIIWYMDWMTETQQPLTIGDVIPLPNPFGAEDTTGHKTEFIQL